MIGPLVGLIGKALANPVVARAALTAGSMVVGVVVRCVSEAAQDRVTEKELDGSLSEGAASSLRAAIRTVDVGTSIAVGAVTGQAAETLKAGSATLGGAVGHAVSRPGATALAYVAGPEDLAGQIKHRHEIAQKGNYLLHGEAKP
jgi:hypothetical protein